MVPFRQAGGPAAVGHESTRAACQTPSPPHPPPPPPFRCMPQACGRRSYETSRLVACLCTARGLLGDGEVGGCGVLAGPGPGPGPVGTRPAPDPCLLCLGPYSTLARPFSSSVRPLSRLPCPALPSPAGPTAPAPQAHSFITQVLPDMIHHASHPHLFPFSFFSPAPSNL